MRFAGCLSSENTIHAMPTSTDSNDLRFHHRDAIVSLIMDKTNQNLWTAFLGEAKANRIYIAFAMKALQEGHPEVAQLFLEVAGAETVHAVSHLHALGEVRSTLENLRLVVESESYESGRMYPKMIQEALAAGRPEAAESFRLAMEREKYHLGVFQEALRDLEKKLAASSKPTTSITETSPSAQTVHAATEAASSPSITEVQKEKGRIATLERIREVVFGMQDGLVSTVAVASSVMAATGQRAVVFVAGLTSALAGMVSMGTGSYLSSKAEKELHLSEIESEARELDAKPEEEMAELIEIYRQEGLTLEEAERLAERVASDRDLWLKTLAEKELGLSLDSLKNPSLDAITMGISFGLGALVPLVPYPFMSTMAVIAVSIAVTVAALFVVGMIKARVIHKHPLRSGLEIMLLGTASGVLGYLIGFLFPRLLGINLAP
jgi:vacuolar iron transporter family protein